MQTDVEFQKIHLYFFQCAKGTGGCDFELSQRNLRGEPELSRGSYSPACLSCQHGQTRMRLIPNYYNFQFPERLINGDKVRRCQHSVCMQELRESRINGLTLNCRTTVFRDLSWICNLLPQCCAVASYGKDMLPVLLCVVI